MKAAQEDALDPPASRATEVRTTLLHLLRLVATELARRLVASESSLVSNGGPPKDRTQQPG